MGLAGEGRCCCCPCGPTALRPAGFEPARRSSRLHHEVTDIFTTAGRSASLRLGFLVKYAGEQAISASVTRSRVSELETCAVARGDLSSGHLHSACVKGG